jgi:signal recognition particle subunit SRP14
MKKRDKKKEKQRAEELAARRKKLYENPIKVLGPKRGKGRRKRQRLAKAALKQEEARKKLEKKGAQKAKATSS